MSGLKGLLLIVLITGCTALPPVPPPQENNITPVPPPQENNITPVPPPQENNITTYFNKDADTFHVVGGIPAAEGSHPHIVALTRGLTVRSFLCGGSIIGPRTVLTAAHCIAAAYVFGSLSSSLRGIVGTNYWNTSGTAYSFSGNATHEHYVAKIDKNDIGLLFTTTDIVYSTVISPISLSYEFVPANTKVRVAGWGRTWVTKYTSEALLEIDVSVMDGQQCIEEVQRMKLNEEFRDSSSVEPHIELCTFHATGVGTCKGDSGSALVRTDNGTQVGVVSWGFPCALGAPDMYVRISAYKDWIESRKQ